MLCIRRDLIEQALAELEQYDILRQQVVQLDSLKGVHVGIIAAQDSLLSLTNDRLRTCDRHMDEAERVILDQTLAHRALVTKTRKERRRLHLLIGLLGAGIIITNL